MSEIISTNQLLILRVLDASINSPEIKRLIQGITTAIIFWGISRIVKIVFVWKVATKD